MPFGPLALPALGLSLLKPILVDAGFAVRIHYATLRFAKLIERDAYDAIAQADPKHLAGDWVFAPSLGGNAPSASPRSAQPAFLREYEADFAKQLATARARAAEFLDEIVGELAAYEPQVVGFTNTFEQSVASLAAAKLLKERLPDVFIVVGGANCEGEMGLELARQFPFVDAVVSGEAESVVVELMTEAVAKRSVRGIAGISTRDGGPPVEPAPLTAAALDKLPFPNYDDFFNDVEQLGLRDVVSPHLLVEASRGCWWGVKQHCTFCGLNGATMTYRSKSPDRFIMELDYLRATYRVNDLSAVDNILDYKYFETVVPRLAERDIDLRLFFEIKANLRKDQVKLLRSAGIREVQPGIESLDSGILRLMRKGSTALQNVQLLKWCKQYGIYPAWNLLYGFPGEDPSAYERMAALVPLLAHLPPPEMAAKIRLDRFSPYFEDPSSHAIVNVRPASAYAAVYGLPTDALERLAYYFEFDYADGRVPAVYATSVVNAVELWRSQHETSDLVMMGMESDLLIVDRRPSAPRPFLVLSGIERAVYVACDRAQTTDAVLTAVRSGEPHARLDQIEEVCTSFVNMGLMIEDERKFLSLAVALTSESASPELQKQIGTAAVNVKRRKTKSRTRP